MTDFKQWKMVHKGGPKQLVRVVAVVYYNNIMPALHNFISLLWLPTSNLETP